MKNYFMLKSLMFSQAGSDEWLLELFYTASENVGCYLYQTMWESMLVVFTEVNVHYPCMNLMEIFHRYMKRHMWGCSSQCYSEC